MATIILMKMPRWAGLLLLSVVAWASVASPPRASDEYPNRPIRLVVGFPPGGPTDLVARVLADALRTQLGQQIIVDNRGGASGNVAAEAAARAEPDGYTVFFNTSAVAVSPALYPRLGYDIRKDFAPVCLVATIPLVLAVNPSVPAKTAREFVDYVRANPGKLSYGSTGIGSVTHLGAALFLISNGLEAVHVPFRGSAPALTAMSGNHVQFMTETVNSAHPLITGGLLRGLAVMGARRVDVLPDLPTLEEAGMQDFEIGGWQGLLVPAATPRRIIDRLNTAARKALVDADVKAKLAAQGATILGSDPEEYGRYIASEITRWAKVVRESGAKAE